MKGGLDEVNAPVFLYLRIVSTLQTSGTTLNYQEITSRTFGEQHGLQVVEVFREASSSRCWQDRNALA
ncbi:hypothetical protein KSF_007850 [Reticulibacter mediterranei]|uniref:Uncharacterized protein n=1 Tax=Reticulibacter mediterranei TaxID=2778369 RepID=A0A8J3N0X3_9CHLR|nr:hypothetical protein [Reticulibacter mediterranei]GHO90737.1 hypothetical protein KSF_007850 [Reticulibacter mediterranei]